MCTAIYAPSQYGRLKLFVRLSGQKARSQEAGKLRTICDYVYYTIKYMH